MELVNNSASVLCNKMAVTSSPRRGNRQHSRRTWLGQRVEFSWSTLVLCEKIVGLVRSSEIKFVIVIVINVVIIAVGRTLNSRAWTQEIYARYTFPLFVSFLPFYRVSDTTEVSTNQWRTEGGGFGGGSTPQPRNSEVLTKSNRIANWAENV